MLIDDVTITVKAGNGGDGAVSFRRNAQTAKGGPDGGNGGNGGSVYFIGVNDISALEKFQYKKTIKAENGINGGKNNLFGRKGKNLTIEVPLGTLVVDESGNSFEIESKDPILIAKGGLGGRGNNEFKSATNQTPKYSEKGGKGEEEKLHLILKIIADVGIIGLPNAGKSSLLKELTNANPKIGSYPFTTLEPNLGVMDRLILADIPGLIEGASKGRGLGFKFLKHIEKTRILIHCIDASSINMEKDYKTVLEEFKKYNKVLVEKKTIIVLTKKDLITNSILLKKMDLFKKFNQKIISVSIIDEASIRRLKALLFNETKNI